MMRCKNLQLLPLLTLLGWLNSASGVGTLDREYGLGDDSFENASIGSIVGSGTAFETTFDSFGTPSFGDLQDLSVQGDPVYADVSDRPLYDGGVGVTFDGTGDYLIGSNLNLPDTSAASVNHDDDPSGVSTPGPNNYAGIVDRYLQFWVKPNSAAQNQTQSVVLDSNQHGVRIENGQWSMRYDGRDFPTGVDVSFDQWSHVMVARPMGATSGSRMYVNGVFVGAAAGGYNGSATEELVVGSNTGRDGDLNFTGGTEEFFNGSLDNLTLSILGDNSDLGGEDFGSFEFALDNEFASDMLSSVGIADVNMDGSVSGDGTGPATSDDVTAFVEGWLFENEINGIRSGDLTSRMKGDLDFSGRTDLRDYAILNMANSALGTAIRDRLFVPEPSSGTLMIAVAMGLLLIVRQRK